MQLPLPSSVARGRFRSRSLRAVPVLAWLAAAAGDAWWVASTRPFSTASDAAVLGGAAVVGVVAARTLPHRRPGLPRLTALRAPGRPQITAWMVVTALIVAYELATLLAGAILGRPAVPTVSSLYDAAARSREAKAAIVFVWLALGWSLFRR